MTALTSGSVAKIEHRPTCASTRNFLAILEACGFTLLLCTARQRHRPRHVIMRIISGRVVLLLQLRRAQGEADEYWRRKVVSPSEACGYTLLRTSADCAQLTCSTRSWRLVVI